MARDSAERTNWHDSFVPCQKSHSWQGCVAAKITAMTALFFVLLFALMIAAWAPARIRDLRSGQASPFDSHDDGHQKYTTTIRL